MSLLRFCGAGLTSRGCRCGIHVQWRGRAVCICTVLLAVGPDGECGMDGTCWKEVAICRIFQHTNLERRGGGGAVALKLGAAQAGPSHVTGAIHSVINCNLKGCACETHKSECLSQWPHCGQCIRSGLRVDETMTPTAGTVTVALHRQHLLIDHFRPSFLLNPHPCRQP